MGRLRYPGHFAHSHAESQGFPAACTDGLLYEQMGPC